MTFKHKHDAVIRAYLEGKAVEWKYPEATVWNREQLSAEKPNMLGFSNTMEYRIAPVSRWLNVYISRLDSQHYTAWADSRQTADVWAARTMMCRIAVIEDKQDGTPWIVHQLEK